MIDKVAFTRGAAARIAKVVRQVESGAQQSRGIGFEPRLQEVPRKDLVFRVGTFTGTWTIDTQKTVTFLNQTATPNTVAAMNLFATLAGSTATTSVRNCAIAREGTAWYLIAAECD